jgi:xylulose-5-phosphate/fructose-6-phosphate phosphoketolase
VIVAGKQPSSAVADDGSGDQALHRRPRHLGLGQQRPGREPDVVMACCGDVPTLETLAAVQLLRQHVPDLKVRVINIVNLMKLQPHEEHPHGLTDRSSTCSSPRTSRSSFAFHGYPWLIHRLTYRRTNHANVHVPGYKEEGPPPPPSTWSCSTTWIASTSSRT